MIFWFCLYKIEMSLPTSTKLQGNIEEWDAPLLALAQRSQGDMKVLLYAFFSFLHRRTDFYMVPDELDLQEGVPLKMGFRPGDAEKALLAAFRQFPLRKIPRMIHNEDNCKSTEGLIDNKSNAQAILTQKGNENEAQDSSSIQYTEQGKQIPVGNGGCTKSYQWTQTLDEITLLLPVPAQIRAKDLHVSIKATEISILLNKDGSHYLLQGSLSNKIKCDESTWTMEGQVLSITLDKAVKTWWDCVLEGDEKIDTSLVDSKRKISEYDACTQGMIRKIMFDQQQKRLGKPTSDEILGNTVIPPLPPGVEYLDRSSFPQDDH